MATISRRHVLKFAGVAAIATALPPTLDSSRAGAQDVVTTPDGFVVVRDEGALSLSPSAAPISYYAASMGGDAAVTVDVEAVGSTAQTSLSRIGLDGTSSSATGALQSIVPSTIDVAETTPLVHVSIAQNTGVAAALTQVNVSAAATGNSGDDPTSAAASQYTLQQKAMDPWQLLVSPPALPPGVTAVTTPLVPPAADIRPGVSYVFADLFGVNPPALRSSVLVDSFPDAAGIIDSVIALSSQSLDKANLAAGDSVMAASVYVLRQASAATSAALAAATWYHLVFPTVPPDPYGSKVPTITSTPVSPIEGFSHLVKGFPPTNVVNSIIYAHSGYLFALDPVSGAQVQQVDLIADRTSFVPGSGIAARVRMYHYGYYGLDRGVAAISPTTGSAQLFDADLHPIQTVTFSFSGSLTAATESSVSENVVMVDRSLLAVASQLDGGGIYMATLDDGVIRRSGAGNGLYSFLSRPSTPDSGVIAYQAVGDGSYTQQFFGVDPSQDGPVLPAPAGTTDAL